MLWASPVATGLKDEPWKSLSKPLQPFYQVQPRGTGDRGKLLTLRSSAVKTAAGDLSRLRPAGVGTRIYFSSWSQSLKTQCSQPTKTSHFTKAHKQRSYLTTLDLKTVSFLSHLSYKHPSALLPRYLLLKTPGCGQYYAFPSAKSLSSSIPYQQ